MTLFADFGCGFFFGCFLALAVCFDLAPRRLREELEERVRLLPLLVPAGIGSKWKTTEGEV